MSKSRILTILLSVLIVLVAINLALRLVEWSRFLDLPVNSPVSHLQQGDWTTIEKSVQTWTYGPSRYFILRKEVRVFPPEYDSSNAVYEYFDSWLENHGWSEFPEAANSPCVLWLPESEFLFDGQNKPITYIRGGEDPFSETPMVCLAIWPMIENEEAYGFNVVLLTSKPSPLTIWGSIWD